MTLVLKFGVRHFVDGQGAAHAEMREASQYFNALAAIERWRRKAYAEIRSRHVPGLSEIEEAYEQLDEWIGEHAGKKGVRGAIREKRRKASAPKVRGEKATPTKRVDAHQEIDTMAELKRWRKEGAEIAKPLRAAFERLEEPARREYLVRSSGAPRHLWDRLASLTGKEKLSAAEKKELEGLRDEIAQASLKTHARKASNARALEEMLGEPQWHDAWKDVARLDRVAYELRAWMQEAHSLHHGTYSAVRDAVALASKRPPPRPDGEPRKPKLRPSFSRKFLRKIGAQLQGRITWGDLLDGKHSGIRVSDMRPTRHGKTARATIGIRLSGRGWVQTDVVLHRKIPRDTRISWVYLVPESRPHGRWRYSVQFTADPTKPLIEHAVGTGHVHVHLRWTQHETNTLEIASINGDPITLPSEIIHRLRSAERTRGYAENHFNAARGVMQLVSGSWPGLLPPEIVKACEGIVKWRGHGRLAVVSMQLRDLLSKERELPLWKAWRDERLSRGEDLFAPFDEYARWLLAREEDVDACGVLSCWLETWRRKDRHLEQMADGTRRRAMRRRLDFYRVVARDLSHRYETYSLGGAVDLRALALRDKSEDAPKELHRQARHNRQLAACHEFKEALKNAFGKERFREEPSAEESPRSARSRGADAEFDAAGGAP